MQGGLLFGNGFVRDIIGNPDPSPGNAEHSIILMGYAGINFGRAMTELVCISFNLSRKCILEIIAILLLSLAFIYK
jgi:hypothetical protein